tara:strand:+ start:365 stop:1564 length:1200 start_codon:yes stop_codon:yes gene_type:complete
MSDGSLYRVADGWMFQIENGRLPSGGRRYIRGRADTKREARRKMREAQAKLDSHLEGQHSFKTLGQYLTWYIARRRDDSNYQDNSFRSLESTCRNHLIPQIGGLEFDGPYRLSKKSIYDFLDKKKRTSAPSVPTTCFDTLVSALNYGRELEMLPEQLPTDRMKRPSKPKQKPVKIWTNADVGAFLKTVDNSDVARHRSLWWVWATTAVRQNELLGLCWNNVDWHHRTPSGDEVVQITLHHQLKRRHNSRITKLAKRANGGSYYLGQTKTDSTQFRSIILTPKTKRLLLERWEESRDEQKCDVGDLIWTSQNFRPINAGVFRQEFEQICELSGISGPSEGITPHKIRHIVATAMMDDGISPADTAATMGWADTNTLFKHYAASKQTAKYDQAKSMTKRIG